MDLHFLDIQTFDPKPISRIKNKQSTLLGYHIGGEKKQLEEKIKGKTIKLFSCYKSEEKKNHPNRF